MKQVIYCIVDSIHFFRLDGTPLRPLQRGAERRGYGIHSEILTNVTPLCAFEPSVRGTSVIGKQRRKLKTLTIEMNRSERKATLMLRG